MSRSRMGLATAIVGAAIFAAPITSGEPAAALAVDDGRSDVFAINTNDNGMTAVHVLDAVGTYQSFSLHALTALGTTQSPNWRLFAADYNGDRVTDLYATNADDGGRTAVHVLNGADNFQTFLVHSLSDLPATVGDDWTLTAGDYDGDGRGDLFAIDRDDNGESSVQVLSAASGFTQYLESTTVLWHATPSALWDWDTGDFDHDGTVDLFAINKDDGGSTAVHVLSGASSFQRFLLQTRTAMGVTTNPVFELEVGDHDGDGRADVYLLHRSDTGRTAVHVLPAANNFQAYSVHALSAMHATTDPVWTLQVAVTSDPAAYAAAEADETWEPADDAPPVLYRSVGLPIKYLTYNVKNHPTWAGRRDQIVALINGQNPDIFGLQETRVDKPSTADNMADWLQGKFAGEYTVVRKPLGGDAWDSPKMIWVRTPRDGGAGFTVVKSSAFEFTKVASCASSSGESATWALLQHTSNRRVLVVNTHFTPNPAGPLESCSEARELQATAVRKRIRTLLKNNGWKIPVIISGDLNVHSASTNESTLQILDAPRRISSTRVLDLQTRNLDDPEPTKNLGWPDKACGSVDANCGPVDKARLDYIWHQGFNVSGWARIGRAAIKVGDVDMTPSDHYGVVATLTIPPAG